MKRDGGAYSLAYQKPICDLFNHVTTSLMKLAVGKRNVAKKLGSYRIFKVVIKNVITSHKLPPEENLHLRNIQLMQP